MADIRFGSPRGARDAQVASFRPPVGVTRMDRNPKTAPVAPGLRRWLRFDKNGRTSMLNVDKLVIAQKTGVQVSVVTKLHSCWCRKNSTRASGCMLLKMGSLA